MAKLNRDAGSFRDPSGFIFSRDGVFHIAKLTLTIDRIITTF